MNINIKTILEKNLITVKEIRHDSFTIPIKSPQDFAKALGYEVAKITKSVFLRTKKGDHYAMAVCSVGEKLDFKVIALILGYSKMEIASKEELSVLVGYPSSGVCAIGLQGEIPIIIDEGVMSYSSILTGSGELAVEIEITPLDLAVLSNAIIAKITF